MLSFFLAPFMAMATQNLSSLPVSTTADDYRTLVTPLMAASLFNWSMPAKPLGIVGVDLAVSASATPLGDKQSQVLNKYFSPAGESQSPLSSLGFVPLAGVFAQKGLPWDIDIAAQVSTLPKTNIYLLGLGIQYGFINGIAPLPSVAARACGSFSLGSDGYSFSSLGGDVVASLPLPMLQPYISVGYVKSESAGIFKTSIEGAVVHVGLRVSPLPLLALTGDLQVGPDGSTGYLGKLSLGI